MHPTLFKIPYLPEWLGDVKSYGVMMMIGFLTGIWLAVRRAYRTQADPDIVLNIGFIALVFGVLGARIMFVAHYWDTHFANRPNPILATLDIRAGGLEFWGGPLLVIPTVIFYIRYMAKSSVRLYLDLVVPSLAWGLGVIRFGCFLNGCCWGSVCVDEHDPLRERAQVPWAVHFPYGSSPMMQQYKFGQLTLSKELIYIHGSGESYPYPRDSLAEAAADGGHSRSRYESSVDLARKELQRAIDQGGLAPSTVQDLSSALSRAEEAFAGHKKSMIGGVERRCSEYGLTPVELLALADAYRSKPVHPSQIYAVINGFLLWMLLASMFYYRRRHGILLGWFLILYSIARLFEEMIRQDNPLDIGGITISQAISICTMAAGFIWLWLMSRLPLKSPRAAPFIPEDEEPEPIQARKAK